MKNNMPGRHRVISVGALLIWLTLHTAACVALDQSRSPEEKGIRRADSLQSLAGVYSAALPGSPTSPGEILLALYSDGTCLFADKRFSKASAAVMTGKWLMDHHDQRMTLRLKNDRGAQRVLMLTHQEPDFKLTGTEYGNDGLVLTRQEPAAR